MLLIRGKKRCLAHTQILAAPRIRTVLSNVTFINVFMFLTPPRHAAGYGHRGGHSMYVGTPMEVYIRHVCALTQCMKTLEPSRPRCVQMCVCVYAGSPVVALVTHH